MFSHSSHTSPKVELSKIVLRVLICSEKEPWIQAWTEKSDSKDYSVLKLQTITTLTRAFSYCQCGIIKNRRISIHIICKNIRAMCCK